MAGRIALDGAPNRILKPGQLVPADARVSVLAGPRYASRAATKLLAGLDAFAVEVAARTCLDAGASTGGFTDVLLERGARRVYAIDVGRGQLIERLRHDPRVVTMEGVNLRDVASLPEAIDLATLDLSFISLRLVLPVVRRLLTDTGRAVALVKPQFEAGRDEVPRSGVVRDPDVHRSVLIGFRDAAVQAGFLPTGVIPSPLRGHEGNQEFLVDLRATSASAGGASPLDWPESVERAVRPMGGE